MGAMASQIISPTSVYSAIYSAADQSKHHSSASLAFVRGIHWSPVSSPHKWPVTRKIFPFDDVIMCVWWYRSERRYNIRDHSVYGMVSANDSRLYKLMSSFNGWAHAQNDPKIWFTWNAIGSGFALSGREIFCVVHFWVACENISYGQFIFLVQTYAFYSEPISRISCNMWDRYNWTIHAFCT